MSKNQITQEEIKRIMEIKGEARGTVFLTDAQCILAKKGKAGLKKVEEKTKEWGYHIDYQNIKSMTLYPIGLRALSILAIKEVFGWGKKDIKEMGHLAPTFSVIVKLVMKYLLSLKLTYQKSPSYWRKYYTVGRVENPEYNEKEKYVVLELYDLKVHPILCPYYAGYFLRIAELGAKEKILGIEETKCIFRGDECHQYIIRWK